MKPDTATKKGLLTGIVMILVSIVIFYMKENFENKLQYITYSVYVAGLIWALVDYSKRPDTEHKFGKYFSQGFKCFIVVTLLMVIFTAVFLFSHPLLRDEMGSVYRTDLLKTGNYTMPEIDEKIMMAKKSFFPAMLMAAIFGYLAIGAMVTAIASGFLIQKRKTSSV